MRPFKLQTVLDYRKKRADGMEKELQTCLEYQRAIETEKQEKETEMLQLCEEFENTKQQSKTILDITFYQDCIRYKRRHLLELEEKVRAACAIAEQKRLELVKARQEKRALEILKEKKEEVVKENLRCLEKAFMDEVSVLRFGGKT